MRQSKVRAWDMTWDHTRLATQIGWMSRTNEETRDQLINVIETLCRQDNLSIEEIHAIGDAIELAYRIGTEEN